MLADLLSECYAADFKERWERERTATSVRAFAVRRHATGCSLREIEAILRSVGVERTHQAVWKWYIGSLTAFLARRRSRERNSREPTRTLCVLVTAKPMRVAVNETAVHINGELSWVYAAIDLDSKLLLSVDLFERRGTDPVTKFFSATRRETRSLGH